MRNYINIKVYDEKISIADWIPLGILFRLDKMIYDLKTNRSQ